MKDDAYSMKLYKKLLKLVIKVIGHDDITTNWDLQKCCDLFFKDTDWHFLGVFPSDKIPKIVKSNQILICNADDSTMSGSHWMAMTHDLFYDSFGRTKHKMLPGNTNNTKNTELDAEQKEHENSCGQRSIAWLLLYCYFGKHHAKLI